MKYGRRQPIATLLLIGFATIWIPACAGFGASAGGERLKRMQGSQQYKEDRFANRLPMAEDQWTLAKVLDILKDWINGKQQRKPAPPLMFPALAATEFAAPSTDLTARWLGHSTLIIEIEGKRILTDPVWSERTSPYQFVGPKRFFAPLIPLDRLPPIDAVIISHDHYDHLDMQTVIALKDRVDFYVPLGIGAHLESWGVTTSRIHEFDWWESVDVKGLRLVCTPARHFSGRGVADKNHTLWASWSLIGQKRRAFFGGDSGLFPELSEIGERLGPFDLTMLESGAYNARWPDVHMGPEQAVIAHRALRGKVMLPIHWGLFTLATHGWTEPIERLRRIAETEGDLIAQPRPGDLVTFGHPLPTAKWWPDVRWETAQQAPVWSTHIDPKWLARYNRSAASIALQQATLPAQEPDGNRP